MSETIAASDGYPAEPWPRSISRISTSSTLVPRTSILLQPLHLQFADRKGKQIFMGHVSGDDGNDIIAPNDIEYTLQFHTLNPKMTFHRGEQRRKTDENIVGTGSTHSLSTRVSIHFPAVDLNSTGRDYQLIPAASAWPDKGRYEFISSAFEGGRGGSLTWSSESSWKKWDLICVDKKGAPVARFVRGDLASRSIGRIEFIEEQLLTSIDELESDVQAKIDEIVVVGVSLACDVLKAEARYIMPK